MLILSIPSIPSILSVAVPRTDRDAHVGARWSEGMREKSSQSGFGV